MDGLVNKVNGSNPRSIRGSSLRNILPDPELLDTMAGQHFDASQSDNIEELDQQSSLGYFDPDYETLGAKIIPPTVIVDNMISETTTMIKVSGLHTNGVLLEVVKVLTDLHLRISKAYITADGEWFMDVFYVTDQENKKVTEEPIIDNIGRLLRAHHNEHWSSGFLSQEQNGSARISFDTHLERRLHQITSSDWDTGEEEQNRYSEGTSSPDWDDGDEEEAKSSEGTSSSDWDNDDEEKSRSSEGRRVITVTSCKEKGYLFANVKSNNYPRLLFDTVFTLREMKHVVFHGNINYENGYLHQEYYTRDECGGLLESTLTDKWQNLIIKRLELAIGQHVPDGVKSELSTNAKIGFLSKIKAQFEQIIMGVNSLCMN